MPPVCHKCGIIEKSGQNSCCGRGGSWFRNCGGLGNAKPDHTWYEGVQACKIGAQFKRASGRQSNAAQRLNSYNGVGAGNPKGVKAFVNNTSTPFQVRPTSVLLANVSMSKSTGTPDDTSNEYDVGTKIISESSSMRMNNTPMADADQAITLTSTITTTGTDIMYQELTMISHPAKEATMSTDWKLQGMYRMYLHLLC